jgi:alpha-tubulin suppressor-like RCC1 family protein
LGYWLQLGKGNTTDLTTWTQVTGLPLNAGTTITKVIVTGTGSYNSSYILASDGSVFSCGYNGNGGLGVGDATLRNVFTPVPIGGSRYVTDINTSSLSNEVALSLAAQTKLVTMTLKQLGHQRP